MGDVLRRHAHRRLGCLRHLLAAAIAQSPLTDGLAAVMMSMLKNGNASSHWLCSTVLALFGRQPISTPRSRNARGPLHRRYARRPGGVISFSEGWDDMARPGGRAVELLLASTSATRCLRAYPSAHCPRGRRHCARPARPRGRSQSTRGRIVPQRRWSLRRLRRRSELRRRAANRGRLPPPPREDRSPKGVVTAPRRVPESGIVVVLSAAKRGRRKRRLGVNRD